MCVARACVHVRKFVTAGENAYVCMCPRSPKEKSWCHSSSAINLLSSPRAGACCESELTQWMKMAGQKVLRSAYLCLPRTRKSVHSHIRLFFFCLSGFQKSSSSTVLSVVLSLLSNILFFFLVFCERAMQRKILFLLAHRYLHVINKEQLKLEFGICCLIFKIKLFIF